MFIPKYRRKILYGQIRSELKEVFHRLAYQKECCIEEGYLVKDHVHMLLSIPPKYSVSTIVEFLKGKSAMHIARQFGNIKRSFCWSKFLGTRVFCLNGRFQ